MTDFDPRSLPIHEHRDDILQALASHRVLVVEGPTGCGKTTQLPRILHEAGMTEHGIVGVTQPRRIAAVSVAWRIASELGVALGDEVGYAIRFDDKTSKATRIKVMTDGLLLQEAHGDADFGAYSVIIVDEAHERSLNIDLTLGLLHRALERRDDLRVIVSSATLQPETFEDFFGDLGPVCRIHIDVRTHPIDIVYAPPATPSAEDLVDAVADEVHRLHRRGEPGHILTFLSGEKLIRQTQDAIMARGSTRNMAVLPLFGRLKREEQEQVFAEFGEGIRKVILATNIAETSITVPGVNHVIDSGLAKIPRFDGRTAITTLREEWISRASAEQRAGRAGRTGPGSCVRLYPEHTMQRRPPYTEEEILRLDLSEVVLRLVDLGIKDIEQFAMPTAPPRRKLRGALGALIQLGAVDSERNLTEVGRAMVPFPLGPTTARMVVEAARKYPNVVDEILTVAAWMSVREPWLFPEGEELLARKAHDRLASEHGDALTALHVMEGYRRANNKRAYAEQNYLERDTLAFVEKAHGQLKDIASSLGIDIQSGGRGRDIARCVAVGHPTGLMRRIGRAYETATGAQAIIHPSSSLFGTRHDYVVAGSLFRTRQLYATQISPVDPEWILELAPDVAQQWELGRLRRKKQRREDDEAMATASEAAEPGLPPSLTLAGIDLPMRQRRKSIFVMIPMEAVPRLRDAWKQKGAHLLKELPPGAERWRASVRNETEFGRDLWLHELLLPQVLNLLPFVELPEPGQPPLPADTVPQGALLDHERNLHTIERFLEHTMQPMRPMRGKKPGWLMLVTNGAGGYWFEVTPAYDEALAQTLDAVTELEDDLPDGDPLRERLQTQAERLREQRDIVRVALSRKGRGQKRR